MGSVDAGKRAGSSVRWREPVANPAARDWGYPKDIPLWQLARSWSPKPKFPKHQAPTGQSPGPKQLG